LEVFFCQDCAHLQLLHVIDPEILFRHYVYVSGTSSVMRRHLSDYAQMVHSLCLAKKQDLVVEFGSNDGTLLRFFKDLDYRILGVDPAVNLAQSATSSGIETLPEFFNKETASSIVAKYGKAKIICANHCCAHIDDFLGVVDGVKILLEEGGVWIFEVGYLLDVYTKGLFDTIYHEHVDFHTVTPLIKCFKAQGLKVINVTRSSIQGGALRCFVGWESTAPVIKGGAESIQKLISAEVSIGLGTKETFLAWSESINRTGAELKVLLKGLRENGNRIVGYGAPAKATTLLYHFGISLKEIEYIVDDNDLKQNMLSPGLHIPILHPSKILQDKPNYVLILAWNFADSIIEQNRSYLESGGRFIIPLPSISIVK